MFEDKSALDKSDASITASSNLGWFKFFTMRDAIVLTLSDLSDCEPSLLWYTICDSCER